MNREDVIRLAREAGWPGIYAKPLFSITLQEDDFLRFAGLVAAAQSELIAAWVEDMCNGLDAKTIADGIRNGGNDDIQAFEVRKFRLLR